MAIGRPVRTPSRRLSWLLGLAALGALTDCRGCEGAERPPAEPCAALEPPAPWLVLRTVDESRGRLRLLGIEASQPTLAARAPLELAAAAVPNWPGHYQAVVAHAGPLVAAAAAGGPAPGALELQRLDGAGPGARELAIGPAPPTAIFFVSERYLVVGAAGALASIDLEAEPLTARPVTAADGAVPATAPDPRAFGLFAHSGRRLVAVAERGVPPWAEVLRLDCGGRLELDRAGALPRLANGSYSEVAVADDEVLLVAHYDAESGAGHLVVRIDLDRLAGGDLGNVVLNTPVAGRPPLVEEFEPDPHEHERPRRLLAGPALTPWAGLAVVGDHVLIGAGERGIFVLGRRFDGEEAASRLDVGGRCLDVTARGATAYALVEAGERTVIRKVSFDRPRNRFVLAGETLVEGRWEAFVR